MTIPTLKVIASLLQLHGPGATIQSDHQGINTLLDSARKPIADPSTQPQGSDSQTVESATSGLTQVYFRRGFGRGPYGGVFRRVGGYPYGGFRRGVFGRAY